MNILLLGSGGREHAIAWKLTQSPRLSKLWIAPGNPAMKDLGELVPQVDLMDLDVLGFDGINMVFNNFILFFVVGNVMISRQEISNFNLIINIFVDKSENR